MVCDNFKNINLYHYIWKLVIKKNVAFDFFVYKYI
jgi:hypothetical protein